MIRPAIRKLRRALTADYLGSHLGYFAVLPVLPVLLADRLATGPAGTGAALLVLVLTMRVSSLFVSGWLESASPRVCMAAGLAGAGVAFLALAVAPVLLVVLLLLAAAGLGISVNGLLSRASVALRCDTAEERLGVFASINVAVNVAAAVGPLAGAWLYHRHGAGPLLVLVTAAYLAAAAAVAALLPGPEPAPRPGGSSVRARLRAVRALLGEPAVRRLGVGTALGWFLYAQLFSALPLFLRDVVADGALVGTFFALNAVLVIALQVPLGKLAARVLRSGRPPYQLLLAGCALLAASFLLFAAASPVPALGYAGIAVFSVGEMLFTPLVDTAFGEIRSESRLEPYNVRQVVTAAGESLGSFAGAAGYLVLARHAGPAAYWLVVAGVGAVAVGLTAGWARAAVPAGAAG